MSSFFSKLLEPLRNQRGQVRGAPRVLQAGTAGRPGVSPEETLRVAKLFESFLAPGTDFGTRFQSALAGGREAGLQDILLKALGAGATQQAVQPFELEQIAAKGLFGGGTRGTRATRAGGGGVLGAGGLTNIGQLTSISRQFQEREQAARTAVQDLLPDRETGKFTDTAKETEFNKLNREFKASNLREAEQLEQLAETFAATGNGAAAQFALQQSELIRAAGLGFGGRVGSLTRRPQADAGGGDRGAITINGRTIEGTTDEIIRVLQQERGGRARPGAAQRGAVPTRARAPRRSRRIQEGRQRLIQPGIPEGAGPGELTPGGEVMDVINFLRSILGQAGVRGALGRAPQR